MTSSTSTLLAAIAATLGGGGSRITDPRDLPKVITVGDSATTGLSMMTSTNPGETDFWTYWNTRGVAVDSNNAADTYKTLVNLSGAGVLYAVVSQAIANGADTVSVRFTRDGATPVVVTYAPGTLGYRLYLGWVSPNAIGAALGMSTLDTSTYVTARDALLATTSWKIPDIPQLDLFGRGLKFESSMLVEVKATNAQNGTTNQERQAGVIYRMR